MGNINLSKRRQALLLEFHNFLSNVLVSAIFLKEQVTYLKTLLKHSRVEKTYTMSTSHFISMRRVHLLWLWKWFALLLLLLLFLFLLLFYLSGFSSQKLTIHRTAGERRGPSFIPLYNFHPLTNIGTFICMWDDYHVFLIATLVFTRLLLDGIYHFNQLPFEWLIDDAMFVCLFTWWIDTRFLLERFDIGNRWIWTCINYHRLFYELILS